ncbi:MAG: hypothetical protein C0600_00160 [Ignavibacteria bacterium]|nr:MAG: hypothetical protein C0600_00160 [Ignavibacteria bacterium]
MKEQLKKLTSDSAVYGVSNIVGRFITFLLVPFYTQFLPQSDYGIVAVVYSGIAFLNGVFTFGLEPAYMRFVSGVDTARRNRIFGSSFLFISGSSVLLFALIMLFQPQLQLLLELEDQWRSIIPLALGMVALDAMNIIPFAALRMENRAKRFATIKIISIVINVGLNVLFIAILHESIVWIFVAGVLASLSSTLLLLPTIVSHLRAKMKGPMLRELLRYGLPTMPGAVAIMLIEIIDKPIMLKLTDAATVGVYQANYKLGIFMMLVVTVFRYAWQPFYLQLSEKDDARELFARVLTYFVLLGAIIVVLLSLFIGDLVRIPVPFTERLLIHPDYWGGIGIVPIILFSYVWAGIAQILNAGLYIKKKTMYILIATATGAAVNIATNFLLIPVWGMYGGAAATFAAYFAICIVYAAAGARIYPIRYEYGRLLRIGIALLLAAALWYLVPTPEFLGHVLWRITIIIVFAGVLLLSRFFNAAELREVRRLGSRMRSK